ncbi:MAG TPA: hypothetical protein VH373_03995 [Jatrophihabitantaceae bacterium]|jgi:hypothetical protein
MTAFVSFAGNPTHQMLIALDPDEAFAARYRRFVASAFDRYELDALPGLRPLIVVPAGR